MALTIIPRSEWGARHDDGAGSAPTPASEVWLHHSVTMSAGAVATLSQDVATVRNLEQIGENRFGAGISYTWLVTKAGRVFQGHSPNRQGTHTGGRNSFARAICFIGNYESDEPTSVQLAAAAELLKVAKANGWIKTAKLNGGHRDVKATACPGAKAYSKIGTINAMATSGGQPQPPQEDDMSWNENITFTAPDGKSVTYPAKDYLTWTNYYANMLPGILAAVTTLAGAVADGALEPETILARIESATSTAVTGTVLPMLRTVLQEELGADNQELADNIVASLGRALQPAAPEGVQE